MADYSILVSAISDVGYWRWWSEQLPELFQLEFGGVQIYLPPEDKSKPPSGLIALRFLRPSRVSFIRRDSNLANLPLDWPSQLKEEKIDPFGVSHEEFALNDDVLFNEVVSQTKDEISHFKENSGGRDVKLAFWSGAAGMRIEAAELRLFLMSGEIQLSNVALLHSDWWSYWKEYWKKLDTTEALPKDYACEVTIPIKQD